MVKTTSGVVDTIEQGGLRYARGIPYATAERFHKPVLLDAPDVERTGAVRGPAAPQDPSRLDKVNGPLLDEITQQEDCLVLSVVRPSTAGELPVMVWFHGGAYVSGGGEAPKYDADSLARRGVVAVNVSYRLGALGYLHPEGLGDDNLGLLDQLTALQWVRANIAGFGGDPKRVTIFGQSAGADSALCLLAAPTARGLFHRVIAQSAPIGVRIGDKDLVAQRAPMVRAMRAALTAAFLTNPATAPINEVLAAQRAALAAAQSFGLASGLGYGPNAGSEPLPESLEEQWKKVAPEVELFIGYTHDDAAPFVSSIPQITRLPKPIQPAAVRVATSVATKKLFNVKAMADLWRTAGGKVATYRFDWHPESGGPFGATHCIDLPFLFDGDWSDAPMLDGQAVPSSLRQEVQDAWTNFARDGLSALRSDRLRFA
jgi:para-nitrobenzyl esterase